MNQISIHQAKTQLWQLLKRVAEGEEIIIAKSGKPVVRLFPLCAERDGSAGPGATQSKIRIKKLRRASSERNARR